MHQEIETKRAAYQEQLGAARVQAAEAARVVARLEGAVLACDELLEEERRTQERAA